MPQFSIKFRDFSDSIISENQRDILLKLVFDRLSQVTYQILVIDDSGVTIVKVKSNKTIEFISCAYSYKDWLIEELKN